MIKNEEMKLAIGMRGYTRLTDIEQNASVRRGSLYIRDENQGEEL